MSRLERDAARDLLPLHAGGDLDPETHAAVTAAVAEHDLTGELAAWEELDAMLTDALTPAAAEAAEPDWAALLAEAPPQPAIRRHCPYCKDDLGSEAVVFCATCATPHHEPCFAEHQGCSLLGCGGTESVTLEGAKARVCAECARTTPADAPFCAWCGEALEGEAPRPRHEQVIELPQPPSWRPLLAAASLLLTLGLGVGGLFGLQQRPLIGGLRASLRGSGAGRGDAEFERPAKRFLAEVRAGQRLYRERDLDRNGVRDAAPDLERLTRAVRELARAHGGRPSDLLVPPDAGGWTVHYAAAPDGSRFAVLLVPVIPWVNAQLLDVEGRIRNAPGAVTLDPTTLRPVIKESTRDRR